MNGGQDKLTSIKSMARSLPGRVVLVLQGGGALGSYQPGVYQALQEAGIEPDWIIGTSIGATNASLIAGNPPSERLPKLKEFWKRMEQNSIWNIRTAFPDFNDHCPIGQPLHTGFPTSSGLTPWRMPVTAIRWVPNAPAITRPRRSSRR